MIIHKMQQLTDEWFQIKLGKFSSTDFATVANGQPKTKQKLYMKKAAERITKTRSTDVYMNPHMERGIELEDEARILFEMQTGLDVRQVGFVENNSQWFGVSPDGLIGDNLGLEIKCKDIHTHLECFVNGWDKAYKWQIQGAMFVTERDSWFFVSYNPHYPRDKKLYIEEVKKDQECFDKLSKGLEIAIEETKKYMEVLNG